MIPPPCLGCKNPTASCKSNVLFRTPAQLSVQNHPVPLPDNCSTETHITNHQCSRKIASHTFLFSVWIYPLLSLTGPVICPCHLTGALPSYQYPKIPRSQLAGFTAIFQDITDQRQRPDGRAEAITSKRSTPLKAQAQRHECHYGMYFSPPTPPKQTTHHLVRSMPTFIMIWDCQIFALFFFFFFFFCFFPPMTVSIFEKPRDRICYKHDHATTWYFLLHDIIWHNDSLGHQPGF
ncbi:hypothetical protein QC763_113075 [Podospora pseudopauciseta]|uniref:Uncharacterized protein n=1 Tax=Podospora pseudopauciseta TaxID=2093780 RepID=A0ABR0HZZ9_9PEZI|nr:hypothetical protein QC763_113075 [Podospora pseudopauciseta]